LKSTSARRSQMALSIS